MNSKSQSPYLLNLHELPRRAGEMRHYHLDFSAPDSIGIPLLEIAKGAQVNIDLRAEAVSDGVLLTGEIKSRSKGECGRCLAEIGGEVSEGFQELFAYESRAANDGPSDEDEDLLVLDGDIADLEGPIRDAVILAMPINPLCRMDCPGLCSECGERWDQLDPAHSHEKVDPRWSGLAGWRGE